LAKMAIEKPEGLGDLEHYLVGRMREVTEARVYPPGIWLGDTEDLGEKGYVILSMALAAHENTHAPVQAFEFEGQDVVAGAIRLMEGEENIAGYLVVMAGREVITDSFNMTMPSAGYIRLEQNNGRFNATSIREFGDPTLGVQGTQRLPVPGTLFRIVVPQGAAPSSFGGLPRLAMFLLGALFLAYGLIKRQLDLRPKVELRADAPALAKRQPEPSNTSESQSEAYPGIQQPDTPEPGLPEISLPDLHFDPEKRRRQKRHEPVAPVELTAEIFRAYDIRGIVDKTLDAGVARKVGQAIGSEVLDREAGPVVVGRDGRHSGPELVEGLIQGISSTGCDVISIGAVPTGALYYIANECGSGSGVMVTGSHNPPDYNGFKVMIGGETLSGERISALHGRLENSELRIGKGEVREEFALDRYRERIVSDIQLARPLKVVADCGNGIGGICAADILSAIGADVMPLYDEVDGDFPNHHPDPSEPENLKDLIETINIMDADLGVAFDGDADRLGVVTPSGSIVYADRVMMLYVREILSRNPGARIIYDVKCTGHLRTVIEEAGGEPEMYKTGHSLIKNRMKEVGAPFAGEMSGHFFFKDRWYGFDCGIYSAARLLEILALEERTPEEVLDSLPNSISTPELKVYMNEGENHEFVKQFQEKARFVDARVNTIDGLRADFEDGWGLCRASNTTPVLVVRFDAQSEEALEVIQEAFRLQMLAIRSDLVLPF
ncbi:MAG: phosphomannomutase/phosphoglucomutase, partial [Xanthomonadales bacterium]|nr:phosphomannomutase/phosphoglucomutase [Xanthomonadales bacterium]NIX12723.1 phosphomannomutase/phosphoglucomutase [Xanthomonadales bacterium]